MTGRLLFVVNWDWFFLSHRLPLATGAQDAGYDVHVATADTGAAGAIQRAGCQFHPLRLSPGGMNPLRDAAAVVELARLYRGLAPDIIHHVTIKPILYGSLAARLSPRAHVVNAISGLGFMFTDDPRARRAAPLARMLYRMAFRRKHTQAIFQNPDDLERLVDRRIVDRNRSTLIRGAGVDCSRFVPVPEPAGEALVVLPARLLRDKGIEEFVEAARIINQHGPRARFALVGAPDPTNPRATTSSQLQAWKDEGAVEVWGHQDDMPSVLARSSIVVLPSYQEGLPKALLEAAAAGRPIVTTDVPGCREVVNHGQNGVLVPPRDALSLASAIEGLLASPDTRRRFGAEGRRIAVAEFSVERVVSKTLRLYEDLD